MVSQSDIVPRSRIVAFLITLIATILLIVYMSSSQYLKQDILPNDYLRYQAIGDDKEHVDGTSSIDGERDTEVHIRPETKLSIMCQHVDTKDRSSITSPKYSTMTVTSTGNTDVVIVSIRAYDVLKRASTRGGDIIVIWAVEQNGDGLVSGHVIDHNNGTYTGTVKLFWSGPTEIRARLASSIVNTCLRMNALKIYGNIVYSMQTARGIRGTFTNGYAEEITLCSPYHVIVGYTEICNFTHINGNMSWYCGKPKNTSLHCENIFSFGQSSYNNTVGSDEEKIENPGHGLFPKSLFITARATSDHKTNVLCKNRSPAMSWTDKRPSGYWRDGVWHMTGCKSKPFKTFTKYRSCLAGKTIFIIGDSTFRQYGDFIVNEILGNNSVFVQQKVKVNSSYHNFDNKFEAHGIKVSYLKHEMPYNNVGLPVSEIISEPQLIDDLASKNISDLIVLAHYNSHITAYPQSVYRNRQSELKEAFKRLKRANPSAKLFIKKPHLVIDDAKWFDPHIELLCSEMLAEEFKDMRDKVVLLDCWTTSVTHGITALHPKGKALQSQIQQLLSYIC